MSFFKGDVKASREIQISLMSIILALFVDVNPIPVKEALNLCGFGVGECRMPLTHMSDSNIALLKEELIRHNLIKD